jgi:hypothetical protein
VVIADAADTFDMDQESSSKEALHENRSNGAIGYVGSALLREALQREHEVAAIVRHPEKRLFRL